MGGFLNLKDGGAIAAKEKFPFMVVSRNHIETVKILEETQPGSTPPVGGNRGKGRQGIAAKGCLGALRRRRREEERMSNVKDVLHAKSRDIFTIDEEKSVADAITQMVDHAIGSLIVTSGEVPIGMFTERDVLKVWKEQPGDFKFRDIAVKEGMTSDIIVVGPEDDLEYVMSLMVKNRIRHLPVVDEKKVTGMVSIRDVVRAQVTNLKVENHYLKEYIGGKFF